MSGRLTRGRPAASGDRMDAIIKTGRAARGRRAPQRALRALRYLGIFGLVLALMAAAIFAYAQIRFKANQKRLEELAARVPSEPMNVLLLGSDSRDDLTEEQRKSFGTVPGKRADTIILLHLDEKHQKAVLVHFPRDLRVTGPDGSAGKINAVYGRGADAMVEEVKEITGLPIHHFVEVDFNGFKNIVDRLGGIKVHFERPLKDPESGLDVPEGCVELKGDQALAFVRVRKIDDDFGRITRQQLFVKLLMDQTVSAKTLFNPPKVIGLVNDFANNVQHDADLKVGDAINIARRLKGFDSGKVDMRVVPSSGARIRGVSYVVANKAESEALFSALRSRRPLPPYGRTGVSPIEPPDIKVTVLNGTGVDKLAQNQAATLAEKGFRVMGTGGAVPHSQTTVYYRPGFNEHAGVVANLYGAQVKPIPASIRIEGDVGLVLGENFTQGAGSKPAPPPPKAAQPAEEKALVHPCEG